MGRLIIDGNQVYEIDEECMKKKDCQKRLELQQTQNAKKTEQNMNLKNIDKRKHEF